MTKLPSMAFGLSIFSLAIDNLKQPFSTSLDNGAPFSEPASMVVSRGSS